MKAVGVNGIAYSGYVPVDDAVASSEVLTIDQIVAKCVDAHNSGGKEEEEGEPLPELAPEPTLRRQ